MNTTSHTSDMGCTIHFPVDSIQHQMTILTLVTDILLSIPVIYMPHLSWNIVRQPNTHQQTIHIILATIALKRYHTIWFTPSPLPSPVPPIAQVIPYHESSSQPRLSPISSISQHSPSNHHHLSTSPLLLPPLIHDEAPTRHISDTRNHNNSFLCPQLAKQCRTHPS